MSLVKIRAFWSPLAHSDVENRSKLDDGLTDDVTNLNNSFGVVGGSFVGEGTYSEGSTR